MSRRVNGCTVVFERDMNDEDALEIMRAIRMLTNVAQVSAIDSDHAHLVAKVQVREEIRKEFLALWEKLSK